MKYKVGDKVRVRSDLVVGEYYGGLYFHTCMERLKGKEYTIEMIRTTGNIKLIESIYILSPEMLEPVDEFNIGDVIYDNDFNRPLTILRKAWVVCFQDATTSEFFADERHLSKTKPLQKITRKELAKKGYELVD